LPILTFFGPALHCRPLKTYDFINQRVTRCNELERQRVNPQGKLKICLGGNAPGLEGIPQGLLTCLFHWYAVTACQYVRTVGAIACKHGLTSDTPHKYVTKVIPEVLAFRNKVAAHFAWTTKHQQDSEAERQVSIMPPLTFENGIFCVGSLTLTVRKSGKVSGSREIKPWSITEVHADLCERYWPVSAEKA